MVGGSAGAATVMQLAYTSDDLVKRPVRTKAVVDLWGNFFPYEAMESGEPPIFIVHGTADTTVPQSASTAILQRAQTVGIRAERVTVQGAGHGFESIDIFNTKIPGSNKTIFEGILAFLRDELNVR
jgi:acetyl esterase/lipase